MLAKLSSFALVGIEVMPVEVEVETAAGLLKATIVGLPEPVVRESVHRIERALKNLGYQRPSGRTIVNLAPTGLRKDAGAFDLPIALAMLVTTGQLHPEQLTQCAVSLRGRADLGLAEGIGLAPQTSCPSSKPA